MVEREYVPLLRIFRLLNFRLQPHRYGLEAILSNDRDTMARDSAKSAKGEKKLGIQLGGYEARSKALMKRVADAFSELQEVKTNLESFVQLSVHEQVAGPRRLEALRGEVAKLESREQALQERYQELERDRRESAARIEALEERVMAEAEALNEEALAQLEDDG